MNQTTELKLYEKQALLVKLSTKIGYDIFLGNI